MMKFASIAAAASLASVLVVGSASASIMFDPDQGLTKSGGAVSAARSNTDNMLDGNTSTMFSLGLGGTLGASVFPNRVEAVSVIELTIGNNRAYPESMKVYLGQDATGTR
jgi:hypothetical protein